MEQETNEKCIKFSYLNINYYRTKNKKNIFNFCVYLFLKKTLIHERFTTKLMTRITRNLKPNSVYFFFITKHYSIAHSNQLERL